MHSTTEGQFALDVEAWVSSWAAPASALLGGGSKEPNPYQRKVPEHLRRKGRQPSKARVVDLDALDNPDTVHQIAAAMAMAIPVASTPTKRAAWSKYRRAKKVDLRTWSPPS